MLAEDTSVSAKLLKIVQSYAPLAVIKSVSLAGGVTQTVHISRVDNDFDLSKMLDELRAVQPVTMSVNNQTANAIYCIKFNINEKGGPRHGNFCTKKALLLGLISFLPFCLTAAWTAYNLVAGSPDAGMRSGKFSGM